MKKYTEIERKFLLDENLCDFNYKIGTKIIQGYLFIEKNRQIRIRIINNNEAVMCYKEGSGLTKMEIEYLIPLNEGKKILSRCVIIVSKIRNKISFNNKTWDIDYYPSHNLLIGEIELKSENERFKNLDYVVKEVSGNKKYSNISLGIKNDKK